jgi:hypothetical protein
MSPDPDLEVRWLVHTANGPRIISVQTRSGEYVATVIGLAEPDQPRHRTVAATAEGARDELVQILGGTATIPLPPHSRGRQ